MLTYVNDWWACTAKNEFANGPINVCVALCKLAAKGDPVAERKARALEAALGVLSSFDEGVDLVLHYKYLMVLAGHAEYALHFNASDALSVSQQAYTQAQWHKFQAWYAAWKSA